MLVTLHVHLGRLQIRSLRSHSWEGKSFNRRRNWNCACQASQSHTQKAQPLKATTASAFSFVRFQVLEGVQDAFVEGLGLYYESFSELSSGLY